MSNIQYTYSYKLQLDSRGFQDATSGVVLQNDRSTTASYSNISMAMSLYGVTFHRKVYEPGSIQAEILIQTKDSELPTVDLLTTMLIRRPVSLIIEKSHYQGGQKIIDEYFTVAQNYYIHEISPQFEKRNTRVEVLDKGGSKKKQTVSYNWIYVKLDIYSLDKLLTLSKYSQAHFGESLFNDILKKNKDCFQLHFESTASSVMTHTLSIDMEKRELSHLGYYDNGVLKERIQPYLVQYNESFYDFLRRTANRCGEVFYFEDGKLCVGISTGESTGVKDAGRIIFQRISEAALTIKDYTRDSLKELRSGSYQPDEGKVLSDPVEKKDGFPKEAFPAMDESGRTYAFRYNSEIAPDDQYMMLFKDQFAHDFVDDLWCGDDAEHVMRTVSLLLNSTSLMELLTDFAIKEIDSVTKAKAKAKKTTDKFNKVLEEYAMNTGDKKAVIPMTDPYRSSWITLDYVEDIRNHEEAQMRGMVCVDMGSGFQDVKLGDKITLPSPNHGKTYVVVQIEMSSGKEWQRSYDGFAGGDGMPPGVPSQRFYAIPIASITNVLGKTSDVFFPPLLPIDPFRRAGAQPAFVIDTADPTGQGRVRIRYPWQPKYDSEYESVNVDACQTKATSAKTAMESARKELALYATDIVVNEDDSPMATATKKASASEKEYSDALIEFRTKVGEYYSAMKALAVARIKRVITEAGSPWIRMASPMATSGGGMFFKPEKGDEVMVDFENGNVERPYVTGMLYSKNVPAPKAGSRVIVSKNGHSIKMSDPGNSSELISGLLPPLKMLTRYGVEFKGLDNVATRAMGGIELTDELGFYNIKMSSHDRLISIASPFGNVSISAFTGISISAPNGDINITGKNITLSAFNKVNITSGKNVKLAKDKHRGGYFTTGQDWGDLGKHLGKSVTKLFGINNLFDLSLIRTILEIFIRPVDGALEIKSERFLLLGAGGRVPAGEFADYNVKPFEFMKREANEPLVLKGLLIYMRDSLLQWYMDFHHKYNALVGIINDISPAWDPNQGPMGQARVSFPDEDTMLLDFFGRDPDQLPDDQSYRTQYSNYITNYRYAQGTLAADKTEFEDKGLLMMKAAVDLKKHMLLYNSNHLFSKLTDGSFVTGERLVKIAKECIPSLFSAQDVNSILTLANPVVPAPPAPAGQVPPALAAPANVPAPGVSAVAPGVPVNIGFYKKKVEATMNFIVNRQGQAGVVFNHSFRPRGGQRWIQSVTRRIMCMVIEKVRTSKPFKTFLIPPAKYEPVGGVATAPIKMYQPFSNTDWARYINEIRMEPPQASQAWKARLAAGFMEGVGDTVKKIIPFESDTWSSEKSGQILFSEEKGYSYHFVDNGATVKRPNETRQDAVCKKIQADLKAI